MDAHRTDLELATALLVGRLEKTGGTVPVEVWSAALMLVESEVVESIVRTWRREHGLPDTDDLTTGGIAR